MASKLCCTAEQEAREGSPELPNARLSAATPANKPLLHNKNASQGSRFTSARSEDLHELRQIFDNAKDHDADETTPAKSPRSRFARPSVYSLHSLHKMKSMHALIKRRFSKDMSRKDSNGQPTTSTPKKKPSIAEDADTAAKQARDGPELQLKAAKDGLRKDLLSDKKPAEGGYDSDAEVLDDIARNMGKKSASKRPSIHSIDWTPSTGSKPAPGSANDRYTADQGHESHPYQISNPQRDSRTPIAAQFSVFSTPDLRLNTPKEKDRKLRRSHSATSIILPAPSPLTPMRLPSLLTNDREGKPWSVVMSESLRLSQFPVPPRRSSSEPTHTDSGANSESRECEQTVQFPEFKTTVPGCTGGIEIHVQEPTSTTTPRVSTSIKGTLQENPTSAKDNEASEHGDEEDSTRRSVHLYSMRISHHLRSGSLLSWDALADEPEVLTPPRLFRDRGLSEASRISEIERIQKQLGRHARKTSSSGFASAKVPDKWGKVLGSDRDTREDISSVYSSRPHSPPDSFGASAASLPKSSNQRDASGNSYTDLALPRQSNSYPTDNEATPRPFKRSCATTVQLATDSSVKDPSPNTTARLARNNSVAVSKKSKFREEFSPPPTKKKNTPSASFIRLFNPKRLSMRSQSEANLKALVPDVALDGPADTLHVPSGREQHQHPSRSSVSLNAEQEGASKGEGGELWQRALKAHQAERASMFLPKNKDAAMHASPYRERSHSFMRPSPSTDEKASPMEAFAFTASKQGSTSLLSPPSPGDLGPDYPAPLRTRRSALFDPDKDNISPGHDTRVDFDKQKDTDEHLGAWGRYPSHTRADRTNSAGHEDQVESRDFALEAAIKFAMGDGNEVDDGDIDPAMRVDSPSLPGGKKKRKRIGSSRMAKSNSMTFGKTFLKNYSKMFRSQSTEFQRHGHGHRSSITAGGVLKYPELEILPDVWHRRIAEEAHERAGESSTAQDDAKLNKGKAKMQRDDSMATLRPSQKSGVDGPCDDNMPRFDGANAIKDAEHANDNANANANDQARALSAYYADCLPPFPRASTDTTFQLEDFGLLPLAQSASMHARTLPARFAKNKHARNASVASVASGETDGERSVVSVRRTSRYSRAATANN
ncbi:hypothetical protein BDV95DRAFT_606345 [Massariosphaeria phaeospora]|uniref:Uncharacterized protein n=1 Tax=Massariosphaeria phaeospora TaxID=100035 RepID=A0A7C8IFD9_9PLEO|nr:hypothetical protein BDV95DRAFT_606345 [Massariosphaeria phaeospora]